MGWINATCPVCEGDAEKGEPHVDDQVEYICPQCGHYRVREAAIRGLVSRPLIERRDRLVDARVDAVPGMLPLISEP